MFETVHLDRKLGDWVARSGNYGLVLKIRTPHRDNILLLGNELALLKTQCTFQQTAYSIDSPAGLPTNKKPQLN